MSIDAHLLHTCDVHRPERAKDARGKDTLRWPPEVPVHLTGARCRLVIRAQRVADSPIADRPIITNYRLLVSAGTDVRQGDRIANITFEDGTVDAGPYRIDEVMARRARTVRHVSLLLERLG